MATVVGRHSDPSAAAPGQKSASESISSATPSESKSPSPPPAESLCPRCGGKLVNPTSLGWCPACGYSRAIAEEDREEALLPAHPVKASSPLGIAESFEFLRTCPGWVWLLLAGCATVIGISVAAHLTLPFEESDPDYAKRAWFSAIQLVVGVLAVIAAQVWIAFLVGQYEERLSPMECLLPSKKLWAQGYRRLPATRGPFWLVAWGAVAIACATLIIGGFNYWLTLLPKAPKAKASPMLDIGKGKGKDAPLEDSIRDLAKTVETIDPKEDKPDENAEVRQADCVVIGYEQDGLGTITGLVLAADDETGKRRFAGVARYGLGLKEADKPLAEKGKPKASGEGKEEAEAPTPEQLKAKRSLAEAIIKELPRIISPRCLVKEVPVRATWVQLRAWCKVEYQGTREDGSFRSPRVLEFYHPSEAPSKVKR